MPKKCRSFSTTCCPTPLISAPRVGRCGWRPARSMVCGASNASTRGRVLPRRISSVFSTHSSRGSVSRQRRARAAGSACPSCVNWCGRWGAGPIWYRRRVVPIFVWKYLMSSKTENFRRGWCALFLIAGLVGCANVPASKKPVRVDESTPESALTYYQGLSRLSGAELGRERMVLVAVPQTPYTQVRLAMLLGHPRVQQDLGKGLSLLDSVLKSSDPAAIAFHPLARAVADNYLERTKLDGQLEKQGQQLKDSQRRATELQEKLDSLADIERTLTPRPAVVRPGGAKR